jgi:hypothetical protein
MRNPFARPADVAPASAEDAAIALAVVGGVSLLYSFLLVVGAAMTWLILLLAITGVVCSVGAVIVRAQTRR